MELGAYRNFTYQFFKGHEMSKVKSIDSVGQCMIAPHDVEILGRKPILKWGGGAVKIKKK